MADEEAFFVVVGVDEPAGDAFCAVTTHFTTLGVEDVYAFDLDADLAVVREDIDASYCDMAADQEREREALEWSEALIGDGSAKGRDSR